MLGNHANYKEQKGANSADIVKEFDRILGKACKVAINEEGEGEEQNSGWFKILKFLDEWQKNAHKLVYEAINAANEAACIKEFASLQHDPEE